MYGWCPYIKEGTLKDKECHFDGYCYECEYYNPQIKYECEHSIAYKMKIQDEEENIQD